MKYFKRKFISIIFQFIIIFNILLFEIPAHSEINRQKNVLILNSYYKEMVFIEFHSNTKHFFIILDKTSQGVTYYDQLRQLVHLYEDKVYFLFCNDYDIDVVKEKIDTLSKDTVIFTSAQFKDSSGTFISLVNLIKETSLQLKFHLNL